MAEDDDKIENAQDRASMTSWLDNILAPPKAPASTTLDDAPRQSGPTFRYQLAFKTDFKIPSKADLIKVEVREVPEQVYAASAKNIEPGTWDFDCDHLDSVSFYADSKDGLRQSTTVVGKFYLRRDEDDREWSELETSRLVLIDNAVDPVETFEPPEALEPESRSVKETLVASMIDLDVNIDSSGDDYEQQISVTFSDMAPGAQLTAGKMNQDGTWTVQQQDLMGLGIFVPDNTPPFDLRLTLGSVADEGGEDAAIINIDIPRTVIDESGDALLLRLSGTATDTPQRIRMFADGTEFYDRVICWGDDPDIPIDITVAIPELDGLPFELLIREEALGSTTQLPVTLLALEFGDKVMPLDGDQFRGNILPTASGVSWQGDLIISTRDFDKQRAVRNADMEKADEAFSEPERVAPPSADQHTEPDPKEPGNNDDVLVINVSSSDIDQTGFVAELGALQTFIRERQDTDEEVVYERLGLTIKNWKDISVLGPTNAEVDLSPAFPNVAPQGGRDNTLQTVPLAVRPGLLREYDFVEIHGLPDGCLISHGNNLGQGRWRLKSEDVDTAKIIGLSRIRAATARVHVASSLAEPDRDSSTIIGDILVGGTSRRVLPALERAVQIGISLDAKTFDPNGFGKLSLTIGDVPIGVLLTGGVNHGDGIWTMETTTGHQLGFYVSSPGRRFSVSITCVAIDETTGESTVVTHRAKLRPDRMEAVLDRAVNA